VKSPRPAFTLEGLVFALAVFGMIAMSLDAAYTIGIAKGVEIGRKQCAVVPGKQVTSSTPDSCTYANAYGRSTEKRKANEK